MRLGSNIIIFCLIQKSFRPCCMNSLLLLTDRFTHDTKLKLIERVSERVAHFSQNNSRVTSQKELSCSEGCPGVKWCWCSGVQRPKDEAADFPASSHRQTNPGTA